MPGACLDDSKPDEQHDEEQRTENGDTCMEVHGRGNPVQNQQQNAQESNRHGRGYEASP